MLFIELNKFDVGNKQIIVTDALKYNGVICLTKRKAVLYSLLDVLQIKTTYST